MAEQSDSSMWSFIKSRPAKHPLARIIGAAAVADVLGLDVDDPDFVERVRCIKAIGVDDAKA